MAGMLQSFASSQFFYPLMVGLIAYLANRYLLDVVDMTEGFKLAGIAVGAVFLAKLIQDQLSYSSA